MRRLSSWIAAAAVGLASALSPAAAQERGPVVVELFTSQGCSSCPPADALLHKLAQRDDVIALALHVDYWDYIGWKDKFADPAFTRRQKNWARAHGRRTVYTPQMVVQGVSDVVGTHPMDVADLIAAHADSAMRVDLRIGRDGDTITIAADPDAELPDSVVQLVRYRPEAQVSITRGENAGRTLRYSNIVTTWRVLGTWDGSRPLSMTAEAPGPLPVVVLVQEQGYGTIFAAARLR